MSEQTKKQRKAEVNTTALLTSLAQKLADLRELDSEIRAVAGELSGRGLPVSVSGDVYIIANHGVLAADDFSRIEADLLAVPVVAG